MCYRPLQNCDTLLPKVVHKAATGTKMNPQSSLSGPPWHTFLVKTALVALPEPLYLIRSNDILQVVEGPFWHLNASNTRFNRTVSTFLSFGCAWGQKMRPLRRPGLAKDAQSWLKS